MHFCDQFVTRMEVPRLKVTETRELERRRAARQVEPGGMEELWWEGYIFINIKIVIASILTFSEAWGTLDQMSRTLCFQLECKRSGFSIVEL